MQIVSEETAVVTKTRELCQTILDQPSYQTTRQQIETFLINDEAKTRYQTVVEQSELLNHKQHSGVPLSPEEISDFEQHRTALMEHPVARGFLDAQEQLHKIQESIQQYISKTLELGRVPQEEDLGSCGHGCGCHH
jgi:cell fate (sporulation/competence/biofilm development) regulator YlbF (YheA/YmcA/DUF963 family)